VTAFVDSDGRITFTGFYGEYDVLLGDEARRFVLQRGRAEQAVP
jgi:hypothetical protein